jgi:thymidine phosphorylase
VGGGVLGGTLAGAASALSTVDVGAGALVGAALAADESVVLDRIV